MVLRYSDTRQFAAGHDLDKIVQAEHLVLAPTPRGFTLYSSIVGRQSNDRERPSDRLVLPCWLRARYLIHPFSQNLQWPAEITVFSQIPLGLSSESFSAIDHTRGYRKLCSDTTWDDGRVNRDLVLLQTCWSCESGQSTQHTTRKLVKSSESSVSPKADGRGFYRVTLQDARNGASKYAGALESRRLAVV